MNIATSENFTVDKIAKIALKACDQENMKIRYDKNMPNGQPRRLVSNKRIKKICNFKPSVDLKKGIENTVKWYSKINV